MRTKRVPTRPRSAGALRDKNVRPEDVNVRVDEDEEWEWIPTIIIVVAFTLVIGGSLFLFLETDMRMFGRLPPANNIVSQQPGHSANDDGRQTDSTPRTSPSGVDMTGSESLGDSLHHTSGHEELGRAGSKARGPPHSQTSSADNTHCSSSSACPEQSGSHQLGRKDVVLRSGYASMCGLRLVQRAAGRLCIAAGRALVHSELFAI